MGTGKAVDRLFDPNNSFLLTLIDQRKTPHQLLTVSFSSVIFPTEKMFVTEKVFGQMLIYESYKSNKRIHEQENKRCKYAIMPGTLYSVKRCFAFYKETVIFQPIDRE